jgi:hypothetical protein
MKKLTILSILALGSITLSVTPVLAGGNTSYRNIKSNSILECPTQKHIEKYHWGAGGGNYASGKHMILCLENNSQAKWIIYSYVHCAPWDNGGQEYCPDGKVARATMEFNRTEPSKNTYIFNPKKSLIGTNCRIVKRKDQFDSYDWVWSCKKYTPRENLTIMTKGNESAFYVTAGGRDYKYFSKFMFNRSSDPSCVQGISRCETNYPDLFNAIGIPDRRTFYDCRGNAEYCNRQYDGKY